MAAPAADDIQRVLFVAPKVHVYAVPPLSSTQGYKASQWNVDNERSCIFTARIRIVETATRREDDGEDESVRTDVRLEDPKTGDLFANCPYEGAFCVEQVVDSSRFFAIRVVDGPRKAILGIGFEDRSDAFDFGVSLQEVRKHNKLDGDKGGGKSGKSEVKAENVVPEKKDYSLKEGETISITIGNKGRRRTPSNPSPVNGGAMPLPFLPPPPSASDLKKRRNSQLMPVEDASAKLGFDDDAFGDFV